MTRSTRRSGRTSFVLIAGAAALGLVLLLFFYVGDSPAGAASHFMTALAKADAGELAKYAVHGSKTEPEMKKEWEDTLKYSKYLLLQWKVTDSQTQGENQATVRLDYAKSSSVSETNTEHYELQLQKVNGKWKVDVSQIPRDMYPFLPQ